MRPWSERAGKTSVLLLSLLLAGAIRTEGAGPDAPPREEADPPAQHPEHGAEAPASPRWKVAWDGALFGTFNHQGGRRGETDFRSQNWLMAAAARPVGKVTLGLNVMLTLEPLTAPGRGYSEIFQVGEAYEGLQITDHQHPHDLVMQLAGTASVPLGRSRLTLAAAAVGEPSLGPVAFMHRASSSDYPAAPLAHHIFDSTHVATSVILGRVDWGIVSGEGSVFHGREPDEHHYDLEFGAPDSWAARVWLRPKPGWLIQASHGFLKEPEQLEPGDQRRTNVSASWSRHRKNGFTAVTVAAGRNKRQYSLLRSLLIEGTHRSGRSSIFGHFESTEVETEILALPQVVHVPHPGELVGLVNALTIGAVREVAAFRGAAVGLGGDVTFYGVPRLLRNTHGDRPVSFQVFLKVSRADLTRRMWDMTMAQGHDGGGHHH